MVANGYAYSILYTVCVRKHVQPWSYLLARLLLENDLSEQHDVVYNEFMVKREPWIWSSPSFDDSFLVSAPASRLLYPADQLVELCRHDVGGGASLSDLQLPTQGLAGCFLQFGHTKISLGSVCPVLGLRGVDSLHHNRTTERASWQARRI